MSVPKSQAHYGIYETKKTAAKNIRLLMVRRVNAVGKCYCIGIDKNGNKKPEFNKYYEFNELIKL